ncbi:MAG: PP2C family protein-serine/threonine phosphatase [Bacteriovoracaceae bacterium]
MIKLKSYSAQTHQGPYLQLNEDGYDFDLANNLYMVFDGFGGSGVGDACVSKLRESVKTFYSRIYVDPDSTMPFYYSHKYLIEGNALINSLFYSHKLILKENSDKDMMRRAGSSGAFVALSDSLATIASVGNCQCYINRKGTVSKLFFEDSYRFLDDDDFNSQFRTMPLSAFGLFQDFHYQIREIRLEEGDQIVLLTDGIYSRIKEQEIAFMLNQEKEDGHKKISKMFKLANDRGNTDNQTMMILEF